MRSIVKSPNGSIQRERLSITAIILTFNEELHIARCIERIAPMVQRIVVIDSFSTDRTVEIARRLGADVQQRVFKHQADQVRWALENVDIASEWILRLDADEYLEEPLKMEIYDCLRSAPKEVTGLEFKLKVIFRRRWIRHGGYYKTKLLRMWRSGQGNYEQRWMDEKLVLKQGRSIYLNGGDLVDENLKDIGWWTEKHNRYATRQMVDFIGLEYGLWMPENQAAKNAGVENRIKRFLRNTIYAKAPLYWRSVTYFIYRYFFRLGFLDRRQGFVWHFLHGFWFFVLIDAKIDEAHDFIKRNGIQAFKDRLKSHYNIDL